MRQACARTCGARLRGGRGSRWCWWQSWHAYSTPPLRADPSVTACVRDVATAPDCVVAMGPVEAVMAAIRSEEHTSELQSLMRISYAVFCLKKKKKLRRQIINKQQSGVTTQ